MKTFRELTLPIVLAPICLGLFFVNIEPPTGQQAREDNARVERVKARVIAVDNSHVRTNTIIRTEEQILTIRLITGTHKGSEMEAINYLNGKMELDEWYEVGQTILAEYQLQEGKPIHARPCGIYRLHLQIMLIGLFTLLLLLLAGWTGMGAILSFMVSVLMLWKLFFPLLLRGWPPLSTGIVLTALLTGIITFAVAGLNRRGCCAFIGSMLGVLLTCCLATLFTDYFHINGAVRPYAESLLYSGYHHINLTHIFIASVFIASSGAVMDLAMDLATVMDEIHQHKPTISLWEHYRSGMRVGRAVIGTMTTTLLLAYTGSHITMFLLFIAKGLPLANIFNTPLVSAEILNILVGSFGLVTVAPFTAFISALVMRRNSPS